VCVLVQRGGAFVNIGVCPPMNWPSALVGWFNLISLTRIDFSHFPWPVNGSHGSNIAEL
jgi:hypothetical protein